MADTLTLVSLAPGAITTLRALSEGEVAQYQADLDHLREFDASPRYLELVARNQAEFQAALGQWRNSAEALHKDRQLRTSLSIEVNRRLVNYLSTMRLLLDHYEMRLKRRYGKRSAQVIDFEKETRSSFDGNFAYRFLYKLRNFAQHFGFPVTHDHVASRAESAGLLVPTYEADLLLDRGELLRHGDEVWGKLASEIAALPVLIDVEPFLVIMTKELNRIVVATQQLEREALLVTATRVADILREAIALAATPGVALIRENEGSTTYEFVQPPFRLMQWLGLPGFDHPLN